jgi:hypothetical protein
VARWGGGSLRVNSRIPKRGIRPCRFICGGVFDYDFLAFVGGIIPSVMAFLDVLRGIGLRLDRLHTLLRGGFIALCLPTNAGKRPSAG